MKHIRFMKSALSVVAAAALLAACGGGGGGVALVPDTGVPVSATTSPTDAASFVQSMASQQQDQAEPIAVEGATLATSETAEPEPV